MGLLTGKKGLIFGVANERSIAWAIAEALYREGAELGFTYANEILEKRVRPLAEGIGARVIGRCDVARDEEIEGLFNRVRDTFGTLDILVHSIAFANKEELQGEYLNTSREGFRIALDISAYSLAAVTRYAVPLMIPHGGSIITLTYYGSEKVVPNYNVMGVAKAALEASVRYLAADLGPRGIRVNAISPGPIKTLAAAGISGFRDMLHHAAEKAPLRKNTSVEEVGKTALYLCSDLASGVTGEVIYVDGGYSIMGM